MNLKYWSFIHNVVHQLKYVMNAIKKLWIMIMEQLKKLNICVVHTVYHKIKNIKEIFMDIIDKKQNICLIYRLLI